MIPQSTLKRAAWRDDSALDYVHSAVVAALAAGESVTATELMRRIAAPDDFKLLSNALYVLRKRNSFAPYWEKGNRGAFGHARIVYKRAREIADIKADIARTKNIKARERLERELQKRLAEEKF